MRKAKTPHDDGSAAIGLPLSLWWHHPIEDRSSSGLAEASLRIQRRFGFDFVKVSPPGTYQAMDMGTVEAWCGGRRGFGMIVHHPLQVPADWERLAETAEIGSAVAEAMAAIPRIAASLETPLPILQTVFSPIAVAEQMAGIEALRHMLAKHPKIAHAALARIAGCVEDTIAAAIDAGASGAFYAIQQMRHGFFDGKVYAELYRAYDAPCIQRLAAAPLSLVHIHGLDIHYPPMALPANCWLHWETLTPNPTLRQMLEHVDCPLALGLPGALLSDLAGRGGIDAFMDDVLRELDGRPGMLAPGCTLPLDMPHAVIDRWVEVRRRRSAPALPSVSTSLSAPAADASARALDAIVAGACADVLRPSDGAAPGARLKLLLRLEQDLRRPLPVAPFGVEILHPASLAQELGAAAPVESGVRHGARPVLHVLMEPDIPASRLMGLVRILRDVADVRLIEFEPTLWLARDSEARQHFARTIAQQLRGEEGPLWLLGYGRGADHLAWFIETGAAGSRPIAFLGQIAPPRVATTGAARRRERVAWIAWSRWVLFAMALNQPGFVTTPAALLGRMFGHRRGKRVALSAALTAQRRGLERLRPRDAAASWRFVLPVPAAGEGAHSELLDMRTLIAMAADLAPRLSDNP